MLYELSSHEFTFRRSSMNSPETASYNGNIIQATTPYTGNNSQGTPAFIGNNVQGTSPYSAGDDGSMARKRFPSFQGKSNYLTKKVLRSKLKLGLVCVTRE